MSVGCIERVFCVDLQLFLYEARVKSGHFTAENVTENALR